MTNELVLRDKKQRQDPAKVFFGPLTQDIFVLIFMASPVPISVYSQIYHMLYIVGSKGYFTKKKLEVYMWSILKSYCI